MTQTLQLGPLADILDIRDGGWHAAIGVGAALASAGVVLARRAAPRSGPVPTSTSCS